MNHFLIITGIHPVGSTWVTMGELTNDIFIGKVCRQAFELGEKLVRFWKQKKRFKIVDKKMTAFEERMRWLTTYKKQEWPYEYNFWMKNKGIR